VDGVRIVDASIMPDLVRGDTTATVVMMAERMASWVDAPESAA
jgi:choline dehydrogenase-like flavoprotein